VKRSAFLPALAALVLAGLLLAAGLSIAADGYDLSWWTVGGAAVSSGGAYTLNASFGKPDAGALSGGDYTMLGGFWADVPAQHTLYLPRVMRSY
jgi:hypothetical protein